MDDVFPVDDARSVSPDVIAMAAVLERAAPMPLRRITGAGKEQSIAGLPLALPIWGRMEGGKKMRQLLVDTAMPFSIAPARHDKRTGKDTRSLLPRPPDGSQELIRTLRLPIS